MGKRKQKNAHSSFSHRSADKNSQIEKLVFNAFRSRIGFLKKMLAEDGAGAILEDYDLCEPWLSRRKKAVCDECQRIIDKYSAVYSNINVGEEFALLCAASRTIPDDTEQFSFYSLGAALWILDRIAENRKMPEAKEILPRNVPYEEIAAPYYCDISYSDEVVDSLLFLLQRKNDEINRNYQVRSKFYRSRYIFDFAAATENSDSELHRQYRRLLELIPQDAINTAVSHFRDKYLEWLEIYFSELSERAVKIQSIEERIEKIKNKTDLLCREFEKNGQISKKPIKAPLRIPPGIPDFTKPAASVSDKGFGWQDPLKAEMLDIFGKIEDAEKELNDLYEEESNFLYWGADAKTLSFRKMCERMSERTAKKLFDFNVDDPYEICFAFFYLIEIGDNLPWMYNPSIAVLCAASSKLPWQYGEYDEFEDYAWHPEFDEYGTHKRAPEKEKRISDEWMELKYHADYGFGCDSEYSFSSYRNLAQIVYEKTGAVMPRNLERYEIIRRDLKACGLTPKQITSLLPLLSALGELQHQTEFLTYYDADFPEEHPPKTDETGEAEYDIEQSKTEIKKLRGEIKKLQNALHNAHTEARRAKEAMTGMETETRSEHQELIDLRELLFNKQDEKYFTEKIEDDITFPYETIRRTVVFGGHDTWAREIKLKLPNVRFVDRGAIPNAEMIRHADIVWIQTNAIPHMFYNMVIAQVRKHNIPLRYFTYASATKCAEQLVRADMA